MLDPNVLYASLSNEADVTNEPVIVIKETTYCGIRQFEIRKGNSYPYAHVSVWQLRQDSKLWQVVNTYYEGGNKKQDLLSDKVTRAEAKKIALEIMSKVRTATPGGKIVY